MLKINLNNDWLLRYEDLAIGPEKAPLILNKEEDWMACELPCDVHMPLIENNIIEEPLIEDNFYDCEWIEDKSWWFKKEFILDSEVFKEDIIELTFESLDIHGDVFLNGYHLGHHKSAHYPFLREVKSLLRPGKNLLLLRLTTGLEYYSQADLAALKGNISTEKNGNRRSDRGDERRALMRKPQYVFGWDWGPRLASCGIMKDVYLKAHSKACLRGFNINTLSIEEGARLKLSVEIDNLKPISTSEGALEIDILFEGESIKTLSRDFLLLSGTNYIDIDFKIDEPKLWWPNGMGDPNLYELKLNLIIDNKSIDYLETRFGIRTIDLLMDKINDEERLFAFMVNGIRIFAKGANWIPADSIYARVSPEKYSQLVEEAREANFNILRIWGGGIYEQDIFYEKCDEEGILVWQDFMFACSLYPDHLDSFKREVEKEMDYQTKRLRNHPSLALWCGNNENQWIYESWWLEEDNKSLSTGGTHLYNYTAPNIIRKNCPDIAYWNGSPYGGLSPNDNELGNRHHWHDCTMHPDMEKRISPEEYDKVGAKFITEYGYIGPCSKSTIERYHGKHPIDRKGYIWQLHNNTFEKETVPAGIKKHYGYSEDIDLDEYLLYAGLCQGLMLNYSLEAMRFKKNTSGSIFWMYSDCWGEVGWTIVDYYLKRKISYYFVKRAFEPVKLILREGPDRKVEVLGMNDTGLDYDLELEYGYMRFDGLEKTVGSKNVSLKPYSREILFSFDKGYYDLKNGTIFVKSKDDYGDLRPATLRAYDFKELKMPKASLEIISFSQDGDSAKFVLKANSYAHGVHFNLPDNLKLSDQYFDLLPGEYRLVHIDGLDKDFTIDDIVLASIGPKA